MRVGAVVERSSSARPVPPTVPGNVGFPPVFRRDRAGGVPLPTAGRIPAGPSKFATLMRSGAPDGVSVSSEPTSAPFDAGAAGSSTDGDEEDWVVEDRVRQQNRALLESMSREELMETMQSVESVISPDLLAKLEQMYTSGRSLRRPQAPVRPSAPQPVTLSATKMANAGPSAPPAPSDGSFRASSAESGSTPALCVCVVHVCVSGFACINIFSVCIFVCLVL